MKAILMFCLVVLVGACGLLLPAASQSTDVTVSTPLNLKCRMELLTNNDAKCATGVSVTLHNLSLNDEFSFEVSKVTFTVWVRNGRSLLSKVPKVAHGEDLKYDLVKIPPGESKTWPFQFSEVIDPSLVRGEKLLENCLVQVTTAIGYGESVKVLSVMKTNVCISLQ